MAQITAITGLRLPVYRIPFYGFRSTGCAHIGARPTAPHGKMAATEREENRMDDATRYPAERIRAEMIRVLRQNAVGGSLTQEQAETVFDAMAENDDAPEWRAITGGRAEWTALMLVYRSRV